MNQYVYFIQAKDSGNIKIGVSVDPKKRIRSLSTGNGEELVLLGTTLDYKEHELHRKFKDIRLNGEWFSPAPELVAFLSELGIQANEVKKREVKYADNHPFVEASKLFSGEWYDLEDFHLLDSRFEKYMKCTNIEVYDEETYDLIGNDPSRECNVDDDWNVLCQECLLYNIFEDIRHMFDEGLDGIIFNEDTNEMCAVFRRDAFGKHSNEIRQHLITLAGWIEVLDIPLFFGFMSWTENAGFRMEFEVREDIIRDEVA